MHNQLKREEHGENSDEYSTLENCADSFKMDENTSKMIMIALVFPAYPGRI
jgi:hypothetical protein